MKLTIALLSLFLSFATQAQCFKAKVLNEYFSKVLKKTCENFPNEITNWYADLVISEDVTFYQEDIIRLVKLEYLTLSSKMNTGPITIGFDGNIQAPNLDTFRFYDGPFILDTSKGTFVSSKAMSVSARYQKNLIEALRTIRLSSLTLINAKGPMDDEKIILPETYLSLREFSAIKNSTLVGKNIDIDLDGGEISGSTIQGMNLNFYDLKSLRKNTITASKGLRLDNVNSEEAFRLDERSQLDSLSVSQSKAIFPDEGVLKELKEISISGSFISEFKLPETMNNLLKLLINNSTIEHWSMAVSLPKLATLALNNLTGTMGQWPKMPSLLTLNINKFDLSSLRGSLDVHEKLRYINLNDTQMTHFEMDLVSPKSLGAAYLLGNPLIDIEVYNAENAKNLPPYFALYLKSKKTAKRLRRILKRKSVISSVW